MMNLRLICLLSGCSLAFAPVSALAWSQSTATQPVLSAAPTPEPVPATPAPSLDASKTPATVGDNYVLEPEDTVQINVWKEPALSGTVPIRPDGMISLALLGDLRASGFTPMMLSNDITIRLKRYVTDPRVTVTVMTVHVDKVFLLGEVGHVGPIPLTAGLTPLQAISAAGGLTLYANAKHIYILRKELGPDKRVVERRIPFNYKKALKSGDEQGVSLIAGDTIVVP
jgi:polysaccharide export outer membrane protein